MYDEGTIKEWFGMWNSHASDVADLSCPIFETHAHYNIKKYDGYREELLALMNRAGIDKIVIPAIDYETNGQMVEAFLDFEYILYAHGSHPKYLWKEKWTKARWEEYKNFLKGEKCVAVGEAGLDYSYRGFTDIHRINQLDMFNRFIQVANEFELPMILHIRPETEDGESLYDVDEDAKKVLKDSHINHGAVLHCFNGSIQDVNDYMELGVTHFGIGGRITYGNEALEEVVRMMPLEAIVLETDAPFIKLDSDARPNTSLSLLAIAERIADIRGTTTEDIIKITYRNAQLLFARD